MHKLIMKGFDILKSFMQFLQIICLFLLMLHLLFWIGKLIGGSWEWIKPIEPLLSIFVCIGEFFNKGSITFTDVVIEYKYIVTIVLYLVLYYLCGFGISLTETFADKYDDVHRFAKKVQENVYNSSLKTEQENAERKLNEYKIFVSTSVKKKFSHPELGYNLNEQNNIMNKFLSEQTGALPVEHNSGFLYSYKNFANVDNVLNTFFKLIKSNSPLDYIICLQIVETDSLTCVREIEQLSSLEHTNKITTLANSAYRYKFNNTHRYGTTQVGLFQKGNSTIEVHEFIEI